MKERPILFSGPMVRASLDGSKTQARRVVKLPEHFTSLRAARGLEAPRGTWVASYPNPHAIDGEGGCTVFRCPYGIPGDRLWVRETWCGGQHGTSYWYRADWLDHDFGPRWRPSIFMPRAASRILLEITDVRVQRLQEITEEDARAEGAAFHDGRPIGHHGWRHDVNHGVVYSTARDSFVWLWESINGDPKVERDDSGNVIAVRDFSWAANPWVWAITFRRLLP